MSRFFDTDILIYAVSEDPRRDRAQEILSRGGIVSVQVLNECVNVLRRKLRLPWSKIEEIMAALGPGFAEVRPLTRTTHAAAIAISRDHGLSFHDALIVAAAQEARCDTLFSEDLQHGWRLDGLTIQNPFLGP